MNPITRPCPHCGHDYDISARIHGDRVWCPCGGWSLVVMYPDGRTKLVKSLALEPARETTADAALVAEMKEAHAKIADEVAAAHQKIGAQGRFTADYRQGAIDAARHVAHLIRAADAALVAEMTRRMNDLERERDAALEREQDLLAAAEQAWRALLERTPHSVPGGEQACEALHAAIVKSIRK